jgi:hypothetical protein
LNAIRLSSIAFSPSSQPFCAGDLVSEGGYAEGVLHPTQNVEVRHAGLHHDHVRAFQDVELDLAQRLVGIARVHLIGAFVAAQCG